MLPTGHPSLHGFWQCDGCGLWFRGTNIHVTPGGAIWCNLATQCKGWQREREGQLDQQRFRGVEPFRERPA